MQNGVALVLESTNSTLTWSLICSYAKDTAPTCTITGNRIRFMCSGACYPGPASLWDTDCSSESCSPESCTSRRFLKCKSVFNVHVVHRLYKATFAIALATEGDLDTHHRWVAVGTKVLKSYAEEMRLKGIELDWKIYWDLLQRRHSHLRAVCADGNLALTSFMEVQGHCRKVCSSM
jgi:hypothetical protein